MGCWTCAGRYSRFLTITERISAIDASPGTGTQQMLVSRDRKSPGPSFNVFAASELANTDNRDGSSLVGTDYILNVSSILSLT